jgi:DNA-binding transcriptional LysR family regulator
MGFARGSVPDTHWPLRGGGKVHVEGCLFSNDLTLLCEAALGGQGIALLPQTVAGPFLERGELVLVLAKVLGTEVRIVVAYPEREFVPPQVRAFVDLVTVRAPGELVPEPPHAISAGHRGRTVPTGRRTR